VADEKVSIARAQGEPGLGRINSFEIDLRPDEAVELGMTSVARTRIPRWSGFRIKKVVSVGQPKQVIIHRHRERLDRLDGGAEARIVNVAPAHEIHITVKPVVGRK